MAASKTMQRRFGGCGPAARPAACSAALYLAVLCLAPAPVLAQPCAAPLAQLASAPAQGGKFRLITQLCPVLEDSGRVARAEQLRLYDATPGSFPALAPSATAERAPPLRAPLRPGLPPPDRSQARVLALAPALTSAARANGLDPLLLHAVAHVESRHNAQALSPAGARGVMQVMPATAQRFGVSDPTRTLFDADTNLRAAAALLRSLRTRYGNDLRLVLAAYNAGEGAVAKYGNTVPPYPETQAYVREVLAVYHRLGNTFQVLADGSLLARTDLP